VKSFTLSLVKKYRGEINMKLKHHLWIALGIIFIALFLTTIVSKTDATFPLPIPGADPIVVDSESETTVWSLMWENLFTSIPTDDVLEDLEPFAAFGIDAAAAIALEDEHGTGNSALSGLLGLIPILALIAGIAITTLVKNAKSWMLYLPFGLIFVSVWTIWFATPSKLNGIEDMYNAATAAVGGGLGTLMADGTVFSMGLGFFVLLVGSLYGIVAVVLNQLGKLEA
jgi:hypothetical protein